MPNIEKKKKITTTLRDNVDIITPVLEYSHDLWRTLEEPGME